MMIHQEGSFKSRTGQLIYHQAWIPEREIKGVILLVHGLHEHSGRYQHLAAYLARDGFATHGLDHLGHGKSGGDRSFIPSLEDLLLPLEELLKTLRAEYPNHPLFIIGHSVGGLTAANFLIDNQAAFQGAVLSGTLALVPDYVSPLTIQVGKLISKLAPRMRLIGVDYMGISRDPEVVQAYLDDTLVFKGKMTARISSVINEGIFRLDKQGERIRLPLLLLHGGQDRISDPDCSRFLHNLVSSQDNQLIIYPELYHEIFNEPEQDQVLNDVLKWLVGRLE